MLVAGDKAVAYRNVIETLDEVKKQGVRARRTGNLGTLTMVDQQPQNPAKAKPSPSPSW